jgi:DHA1 family multidrug resistance protein-like MFS transporter
MIHTVAWKRTFISAFLAQILSIVGFAFAFPFLPFFIRDLGITNHADQVFWAGLIQAAAGLTLALFAPLWGSLADRYGRKLMVVRAMFAGAVIMVLMATAQSVRQLVVYRLLQGMFTGTVSASVALVASVVPARRSGFALGMMQAAVLIGVCIGPLAGGIVADQVGYRWAFRLGGLILFLAGLFVLFGTRESFTPPPAASTGGTRAGFRRILRTSGFLAAVAVLFSERFSNAIANPSFPLIVQEIIGSPGRLNSITGSIIATAALGGALAAAALGHFGDRLGHRRVLIACALTAAVASAATAGARHLPYLYGVRLLFGLATAGMLPAANAIIHHTIRGENFGKAYGVATSLSMLGFALGPFLGGWLGSVFGIRVPFLVTGAGQVLVVLLVFFAIHPGVSHAENGAQP